MSILYCSIILNGDKHKLAETKDGKQFKMQIKNLLPQILKGIVSDRLEFENYYLTYIRLKEITFICVSLKKLGEERPRKFIETLINKLISTYGGVKELLDKCDLKELSLQKELSIPLENHIEDYNTGVDVQLYRIDEMKTDVDDIKQDLKKGVKQAAQNLGDLNEILLTTKRVKDNAKAFRKDAREAEGATRFCCKPWVKRLFIILAIIVFLGLAYIVAAIIRCNNFNLFCSK